MNQKELMDLLKNKFKALVEENSLTMDEVHIVSKSLTPEEAIGNTSRKDFPILTGREVMLQAEYQGAKGQAFTDAPSEFKGTLREILTLDLDKDLHSRGLFIASLNAVMAKLGLTEHTIHCRTEEPENCAKEILEIVKRDYQDKKIALIGYQPSILEALSKDFTVRVLDLNTKNVGQIRYGIEVEHGIDDYKEVVLDWADVVLCTGSTLCNGTIVQYFDIGKEVIFFGITVAGAAKLLGLKRLCPCSA
ncbi:DUF364 domain-containing protein [Clostridium boliviensis]|uniref:DUF364 domain-containing protein n=1 Tax=Clostridium boliviensis TaxID=318465 RepID=A0ABU4GMW5_9CLOT|nr:DUF364 domain-containing protein [Clostridium boliviensis]MDW2798298.1 DUF364 domain-containing protein [Clostridium boliviensis]